MPNNYHLLHLLLITIVVLSILGTAFMHNTYPYSSSTTSYTNNLYIWKQLDTRLPSEPFGIPLLVNVTVKQIAVGSYHSLLLTHGGEVYSFGGSAFGELGTGESGDGKMVPYHLNQSLFDSEEIGFVAAGQYLSFAVSVDGLTAWAWGLNDDSSNRLGVSPELDGSFPSKTIPTRMNTTVFGGVPIRTIAVMQDSTAILLTNGSVFTVGDNRNGQLGQGSAIVTNTIPTMIDIDGGKLINQLSASGSYALALASDNTLYMWGTYTQNIPVTNDIPTALNMTALDGCTITKISAGGFRLIVLCGDNHTIYHLGDLTSNQYPPVLTHTLQRIDTMSGKSMIDVVSGASFSLILTSDGEIYAYGSDVSSSLGDDAYTLVSTVPVKVNTGQEPIHAIFGGPSDCAFLIGSNNTVYAKGFNDNGKFGDGASGMPTALGKTLYMTYSIGPSITQLSMSKHVLLVDEHNDLFAFGSSSYGQLGNGELSELRESPIKVDKIETQLVGKTISQVSAGNTYSLILCSDGTLYSLGDNQYGQLGDNSTEMRKTPVQVTSFPNGTIIKSIAASTFVSFAITTTGQLYGFGRRDVILSYTDAQSNQVDLYIYGMLGDGMNSDVQMTPVLIDVSGQHVTDVAAGYISTVALTSDGHLYSWGSNLGGLLGIGSSPTQLSHNNRPVRIPQRYFGEELVMRVSCYLHCLAATEKGRVYAWGHNIRGEIGNGRHAFVDLNAGVITMADDPAHQHYPIVITMSNVSFVTRVAAGSLGSLVLSRTENALYYWGHTDDIQPFDTPIKLDTASTISAEKMLTRVYAGTEDIRLETNIRLAALTGTIYCHGLQSNDMNVCSGFGSCVDDDWCVCNSGNVTQTLYGYIVKNGRSGSRCQIGLTANYISKNITAAVVTLVDGLEFHVVNDIWIMEDAKLIILPGTTLYMHEGVSIHVKGALEAVGNETLPIRIVKQTESFGWKRLLFAASATSRMSHVTFEGGGWAAKAALEIRTSDVHATEITVDSANAGVFFCGCLPLLARLKGKTNRSLLLQEAPCS